MPELLLIGTVITVGYLIVTYFQDIREVEVRSKIREAFRESTIKVQHTKSAFGNYLGRVSFKYGDYERVEYMDIFSYSRLVDNFPEAFERYYKERVQKEQRDRDRSYYKAHEEYARSRQRQNHSNLDKHFEELGLKSTATEEQIKSAFRNLAKKYHPDMGGSAQEFDKLKKSYDICMNARKTK